VIGARGGTSFSNKFLQEADLVFFIGSNTDSAGTDGWKLPRQTGSLKVIYLNIDGVDAGNNYRTDVVLIGDAKATAGFMAERIKQKNIRGKAKNAQEIAPAMAALDASVKEAMVSCQVPIHPVRFMKELQSLLPEKSYILVEPSMASIFSAAYIVQEKQGRLFLSNYSHGALGYVLPASIGVAVARPDHTVIAMGGDGSFHFNCGELETYARLGVNVKMVVFNNNVFGWIKGETAHVYHSDFFATNFGAVDYAGVAKAFGIKSYKIDDPGKISETLKLAFEYKGPVLIELRVPDESELVPPVPRWVNDAGEKGLPYFY
jgi:acetolactate synthase-1/2/3 large subunit